ESLRHGVQKGSLLWLLDDTSTSMGGRLLKTFIDRPLASKSEILKRQQAVFELKQEMFQREAIRDHLKNVYDIGRLTGRIASGTASPKDLLFLKRTLHAVPLLQGELENASAPLLQQLRQHITPLPQVVGILESAISDTAGHTVKDGDVIAPGWNEQLDSYRDARKNGKVWIAELEARERAETGIRTLKIGFNKVFGYYIEVTRAQVSSLPEGRYERKQTLANAERFITPELKEKEALILQAEENIEKLESELFAEVRTRIALHVSELQKLAEGVSELDVLQSLASVSATYNWIVPTFSETDELRIVQGRHPVVERMIPAQTFVANDCTMTEQSRMLLITGPNMSGKSTYMRQVALISILAQIGCCVPAESATVPVFDKIFTRIGASDDLASGQSTFMVEMMETAHAVHHATKNSLILLDEIGRGTSTYDGMALAQAIMEYIAQEIGARTLFSTHYHELTVLDQQIPALANVHVTAAEVNGQVVFLHQIQPGPADKSYGIHVAQLAGLPANLIERAEQLLHNFENEKSVTVVGVTEAPTETVLKEDAEQMSFFQEEKNTQPKRIPQKGKDEEYVLNQLKKTNILELTPMKAMNILYELQNKLQK
ncbi:MAG: DNA mismatch repair protein MutS, partial [Bacilli bacterium]